MKEGIGYTVTLNIATIFIVIIFTFLSNVVIYYKGYKVSNMITSSIEKYEGFNDKALAEIEANLTSIGYDRKPIKCSGNNETWHTNVKSFYSIVQGYTCFSMYFPEDLSEYNNNAMKSKIERYINHYRTYGKLNDEAQLYINSNNLIKYNNGESGFCVYKCIYSEKDVNHKNSKLKPYEYFYIVRTNMYANVPIINQIVDYYIYSDTNVLYDFEKMYEDYNYILDED